VDISAEKITRALREVLRRENHPILIHCNKGKHRTGECTVCRAPLQHFCVLSYVAAAPMIDSASNLTPR